MIDITFQALPGFGSFNSRNSQLQYYAYIDRAERLRILVTLTQYRCNGAWYQKLTVELISD